MDKNKSQITWHFSANVNEIEPICIEVRDFLTEYSVNASDIFAIELLIREALTNAVVHGSNADPALQVDCQIEMLGSMVSLKIQDQGSGFDWQSYRATKAGAEVEEGHLKESGRGLSIYSLYASTCSFNQTGNGVFLTRQSEKGEPRGRE